MEKPTGVDDLRERYLRFFAERGHARIPSASLLPDGDPSVLFTTAGMHPLVPYLRGQPHPAGRRLTGVQACVRTGDIEQVGDATHLTFFEMLGNWSLGDYGKRESIHWSHELLTSADGLAIPGERLWITVFAGADGVPRDEEAAETWRELGIPTEHVIFLGMEDNFWAAGAEGPCGPDTEIFYDTSQAPCAADRCAPGVCGCDRFVEIWNNVFMSYERREGGVHALTQHNVDTGMGLERVAAVLSGASSVYEVGGLKDIGEHLLGHSTVAADGLDPRLQRALRICTDHLRTAVFILGDARAPEPDNQGAGYVLRRIIRRALRYCRVLGLPPTAWQRASKRVVAHYGDAYPGLRNREAHVVDSLERERRRFERSLDRGSVLLQRALEQCRSTGEGMLPGEVAFGLYDTHGFPVELTLEVASEHGLAVDTDGFHRCFGEHRERSRSQAAKSGLADDSTQSVRYHTATHLLHAALRAVLGPHVEQRGSNITSERLRFDFSHGRPLSTAERAEVEAWVQAVIGRSLPVTREVLPLQEARRRGALGLFEDRYASQVSVYRVGDASTEVCAGPHVHNTEDLGRFRITKEQSCGAGVRRIRAVLE